MGQFFNSIKEVGKNYKTFDKWEQAEADKTAKKEWLVQNIEVKPDKFEKVENQAKAVIRAAEIMDARSEDNCENMEQVMGFAAVVPGLTIPVAQTLLTPKIFDKVNLHYSSKILSLDKELSKIDVFDPKRDVILKQIKELERKKKKALSKLPTSIQIAGLGLMLLTTLGLIFYGNSKQKEASRIGRYQAKQDELKGLENFAVYTPEQLAEAEEIANTIHNKKERKGIIKAYQELRAMYKAKAGYKKSLAEKDSQELEKLKARNISAENLEIAKDQKELITKVVSDVNIKAENYSENLENAFDTFGTLSWLVAIPLGFGINKLLKYTKASPKVNALVSFFIPTLTALGIQMTGTFEQKDASRIGRYHARQELLNNPERMMKFSEEEMELAKDIKAEPQRTGIFKKIGKSFAFLRDYYKHKKGYKEYKKTVQKENEKLQEAFKQIELTDAQKQEAKQLQSNVFRTFDEIDEMSQRYSEDVEAGTEAAKQIGSITWSIGSIFALTAAGLGIARGKLNLVKPINVLVNMTFKKESSLRKAINNLVEALSKKGRKARVEFQKELLSGRVMSHIKKNGNEAIKDATINVCTEMAQIVSKVDRTNVSGKKVGGILNDLFASHFKQGRIAKWARNITTEGTKLWAYKKWGSEMSEEGLKSLDLKINWENYNTLWKSLIAGGIPILGTIFAVPYMFNAWLTDIQKKAGKIGVMKAMEKLEDPKIFAGDEK